MSKHAAEDTQAPLRQLVENMEKLTYQWRSWEKLTKNQLYDLLKLRSEVFVVEQQSIYQDVDGWDKKALHLLGYQGDRLIAYARLFTPGVKRTEAVLGRVCVHKDARGFGLGKDLLQKRIDYIEKHYPGSAIFTSVQSYRRPIYEKRGFIATSEEYDDGNILHIDMIKPSAHPQ